MHLHQVRLVSFVLIAALAACRGGATGIHSPEASVASSWAADTMCAGRPACTVLRSSRVAAAGGPLEVAELGFRHPADAGDDVVHCDRREYWLVGPSSRRLIATDCAEQWGADNPGPAETTLTGAKMTFRYFEGGSNDTCDTYTAVVDLNAFRIKSEERMTGDSTPSNQCVNRRPSSKNVSPGDGTSERPLVVLHP